MVAVVKRKEFVSSRSVKAKLLVDNLPKNTSFSLSSSGERLFPPPSGLSYSTWFCVERFSSAAQAHPVRLLTIVRRATSSEQHYVCLAVVLSAKDRSLTISTKEELLQTYCKSGERQRFPH